MAVGKNKSFSKRGAGAKRRAVDAFAKKGNYLWFIFLFSDLFINFITLILSPYYRLVRFKGSISL